jgi:hypothetical protein
MMVLLRSVTIATFNQEDIIILAAIWRYAQNARVN